MIVKNYAPRKVVGTWLGIPVRGWMGGTFVKAARNEDAFSEDVGAHGDVTVIQSHNQTGTVVVTLQQASPTNDVLSIKLKIAERVGLLHGITSGPLLLKDGNGTTFIDAPTAWVRKFADVEYAAQGMGREWTFGCAELSMYIGGNLL